MAGTLTHAYFSLDLYDKLSIRSKELLIDYKEHLKTYSQNTDLLFIYNLLSIRKGKKIREFASYTHKEKSFEFFETLVNYIKYNDYMYIPDVMAYLYGMLSHYVLDSSIHPYVYYKCGKVKKDDKDTYKYDGLHAKLENYFDNYLVSIRENINPRKFKCYKFCFNVDSMSKELKEVIDFTYKEVFHINDFSKIYLKSIKQNKTYYHLFKYDSTGIKRKIYKFIDMITPKSISKIEGMSYATKKDKSLLNLEHKVWYNPTDKRIKSDKSVIEIYTNAFEKTVSMISDLNKYIYYDKKINLKKVIGNLSYTTGRDCDIKKELKYFEF